MTDSKAIAAAALSRALAGRACALDSGEIAAQVARPSSPEPVLYAPGPGKPARKPHRKRPSLRDLEYAKVLEDGARLLAARSDCALNNEKRI